ncbi:cupredoxin family copper-binding protein [Saccharothrix sp.]|uniref:cupredoxin domain-containing protein n=1 Tax=Saccharothrix sp. TaxID=1873460 RepID=UPI002811D9DA|nr:cupredoxin family copper-binding protein [Saccharothrix sp.]
MDDDNNRRGGGFALALAALGIAGAVFGLAAAAVAPTAPPVAAEVGLAARAGHAQGAQPAAAAAHQVAISGYAYSPASITVNVGDTVTWTNQDTAPHNVVVTSGPEKFTSPTLQKGQSFSFTFTKPGSYQYYCSVHPDMKASVTVTGSTTTTAPPTTTTTGHPTHPPTTTTAPTTTTTAPPADCVPKESLAPLLAHIKAAHLETSPLQQVNDALAFDNYVKQHTVMLGQVLDPLLASDTHAQVLEPFIAHLKAAHLQTSPLQQMNDALAFDNYVKQHTVLLDQMLTPLLEQATC